MKHVIITLAIVVLSVGTVLAGSTGTALADVTGSQTIPLDTPTANPCNGEPVALQGTSTLTYRSSQSSSGGFHVDLHFDSKGSGTGAFSNPYQYSQTDQYTENTQNTQPPTQYESKEILNLHVVSNGAAPNFLLHVTIGITVNANGTVEAVPLNFNSSCT